MKDQKGKGHAVDNRESGPAPRQNESTADSMLSRVAASASGLTRSSFTVPSNHEIHRGARTLLPESGKILSSASSASSSAWAENSGAAGPASQDTNGSSSFKLSQSQDHVNASEEEFSRFLDETPSLDSPNTVVGPELVASQVHDWGRGNSYSQARPCENITIAEQERIDGEEVLSMLSSKSFPEEFEPPQPDEEVYDWGLSFEQIAQLRAMTKHLLPTPEQHSDAPLADSKALWTDFGDRATNQNSIDSKTDNSRSFRYPEDGLGQDYAEFMQQWEGVLTRYTDEVWGNLLPLVKEARKEVGEAMSEVQTEPGTALRRLVAILGHLGKA